MKYGNALVTTGPGWHSEGWHLSLKWNDTVLLALPLVWDSIGYREEMRNTWKTGQCKGGLLSLTTISTPSTNYCSFGLAHSASNMKRSS